MPELGSLIGQPQGAAPPQQQGAAPAPGAGMSALMQRPPIGSAAPSPGGAPGAAQGRAAPDFQQTVTAVYHLSWFMKRYSDMLKDPNIGKKDMTGAMVEMSADVLGEGLATLPQVMSQLKEFPSDPLQQRQYIAKHFMMARAAEVKILTDHAKAFPRTGHSPPDQPIPQITKPGDKEHDHLQQLESIRSHYGSRAA